MSNMLVVGLGNPGAEFERSRHNVGADAVALVAERFGARFTVSKRERARVASVTIGAVRAVLAIPTTYMNDSGIAVAALVRHYLADDEASLASLVIVHDELDLEPGTLRLKFDGGTAGHNGLKSIGAHLHSLEFCRIRIGVGKPPSAAAGASHVLRRVPKAEREILDEACGRAADAIESILADGFERAMNAVNAR